MTITTLPKVGDKLHAPDMPDWVFTVLEVDERRTDPVRLSEHNSPGTSLGWFRLSALSDYVLIDPEPEEPPKLKVGDKVRVSEEPYMNEPGSYVDPQFNGQVVEIIRERSSMDAWDVKLPTGRTNTINEACLTLITDEPEKPAVPTTFAEGWRPQVGDAVELDRDRNGDWRPGKIAEVDPGDKYQPYRISYVRGDGIQGLFWARADAIRMPASEAVAPKPAAPEAPVDWQKKYEELKVRVARVAREYGVKNDWCSEVERALKELDIEPHYPNYTGTVTITYKVNAKATGDRTDVGRSPEDYLKESLLNQYDVKLDSDWEGSLSVDRVDVSLSEVES